MRRDVLLIGLLSSAFCVILQAQTRIVPKPPFTSQDVERGDQLQAKLAQIRAEIAKMGNTQPLAFKITDNLYSVGTLNGKAYLLTSPQGHIMIGAGYPNTGEIIEKNMQTLGFQLTDVKVILLTMWHNDAAGSAAYLRLKSGAQVMVGFPDIGFLARGGVLPADSNQRPSVTNGRGGQEGQGAQAGQGGGYPPVKVDRALFDADVITVGPLKVTAYMTPGHTPGSTSYAFTTRAGNRDYKVFLFCCWEYPDDLWQNVNISEASGRHLFETFRKVLPVDIYLSNGGYETSGILNQPPNLTVPERIARFKADPKVWVDREIFTGLAASREVEFERKLEKVKATNPSF
jgi:metallo-beta-lactamase class B